MLYPFASLVEVPWIFKLDLLMSLSHWDLVFESLSFTLDNLLWTAFRFIAFFFAISNFLLTLFTNIFILDYLFLSSRISAFKDDFHFFVEIPHLYYHYDHFFLLVFENIYNNCFKVPVCYNFNISAISAWIYIDCFLY